MRCLTCGSLLPAHRSVCVVCDQRFRSNRFAQAVKVAFTTPDPQDPVPAPQDAQTAEQLLALMQGVPLTEGAQPAGTTLRLSTPLSASQLALPTKHDFCTKCGISLLDNPETLVRAIPQDPLDDVVVECDCGTFARLPKWLFK